MTDSKVVDTPSCGQASSAVWICDWPWMVSVYICVSVCTKKYAIKNWGSNLPQILASLKHLRCWHKLW